MRPFLSEKVRVMTEAQATLAFIATQHLQTAMVAEQMGEIPRESARMWLLDHPQEMSPEVLWLLQVEVPCAIAQV